MSPCPPLGIIDRKRAGAWMRARRKASPLRLTQFDVAAGIGEGIGHATISFYEKGQAMPMLETFVGWALALDLDPVEALRELLAEAGTA